MRTEHCPRADAMLMGRRTDDGEPASTPIAHPNLRPGRDAAPVTGHFEPRIRAAAPADADTVRILVGEIAAHQNQSERITTTVARWRELLARDEVLVLLAERGGETLGYLSAVRRLHLWTGQDVLALDDLYVRSSFRSLGIGRALMMELARRNAPERLTISWGVQPDNHDALRFYDRLGASLHHKIVATWSASQQSDGLRT